MFRIRILTILSLLLLPSVAHAGEVRVGMLEIVDAWSRPTAGRTPNGAAYLTIINHGQSADRLVSAQSPASAKVELHTIVTQGSVMKMRPVPAIDIEPGKTVELKPGGYHVMLLGLKSPLAAGKTIPLTVTFEKAGTATIEVSVQRGEGAGTPPVSNQMKH